MCTLEIPDNMNESKWRREREIYGTRIPSASELAEFRNSLMRRTTNPTHNRNKVQKILIPSFAPHSIN